MYYFGCGNSRQHVDWHANSTRMHLIVTHPAQNVFDLQASRPFARCMHTRALHHDLAPYIMWLNHCSCSTSTLSCLCPEHMHNQAVATLTTSRQGCNIRPKDSCSSHTDCSLPTSTIQCTMKVHKVILGKAQQLTTVEHASPCKSRQNRLGLQSTVATHQSQARMVHHR